jgi:hypothetical protein
VQAEFQGTVNTADCGLSFTFGGEGADALLRLIGCVIITLMPEEGLEETLTSLKEIFEFHVESAHYKPLLPVTSRRGIGNIVSTSGRPDLVISE